MIPGRVLPCIAVFSIFLLALAAGAGAQLSNIQISDQTSGVPETQGTFDIVVQVTSDVGISTVRVHLWFEVPEGTTPTQIITLDSLGLNLYGTTVEIPQNASTMNYYIVAYDTLSSGENSDVMTRDVKDTFPPVAGCATDVQVGMGGSHVFNGSASTDNVGIANYTWALTSGGTTARRYGAGPTMDFPVPCEYAGTLTVTDAWGNADSQTFTLTVLDPESPVADAGYELTVYSGDLLFFDGSASADNYQVANFTWQFTHNGSTVKLYGISPEYVFWTPGDYSITLTVTDTAGNSATDQVPVHVLGGQDDGGGIPWWVYALAIMVILIVIAGIAIIRT